MKQSASSSLLVFGSSITRTVERSVALEWLLTNGMGDFACGTVAGPNTRRQHGLFTAGGGPDRPPMLLLAGLDVALERGGERHELSCHQFSGSRHPKGFRLCAEFRKAPFPEWRYEIPGAILRYRVHMPRGRRCVVCSWTLDADSQAAPWRLKVRPLFAYRESDALTQANEGADMSLHWHGDRFSIVPYPGCPEMWFDHGSAEVVAEPCWYYRLQHPWDIALGLDAEEDLFSPCVLIYSPASKTTVAFAAGVEPPDVAVEEPTDAESAEGFIAQLPGLEDGPMTTILAHAAEAFTVRGGDGKTHLLTGFPTPMGNPHAALFALPGLLLCTRRLAEAREIIHDMLQRLVEDSEGAAQDDLPLWLVRAGEQYVDHSRDWDFLREVLAPSAETLMQRYVDNRSPQGFRLAADGLLLSSDKSRPLTWMDARVENWPVTPRTGKPVEVNALWHHALGLLIRWSRRRGLDDAERRFGRLHELCGRSFRHRFWNAALGGLYDVIDTDEKGGVSPAVRPNQIFALSLPGDLLDRRQATCVLQLVENRLLTPVGLRSLSLEDRAFQPRYAGGEVERAAALHQGAIFPWLLGAYVDAVFRVHGRTNSAYARAESCLHTLLNEHLKEGCVGQVSELFHGAPPHKPQGAFAHAPAVGELIRVYAEIKARGW